LTTEEERSRRGARERLHQRGGSRVRSLDRQDWS
jgi:hypothetical protein